MIKKSKKKIPDYGKFCPKSVLKSSLAAQNKKWKPDNSKCAKTGEKTGEI